MKRKFSVKQLFPEMMEAMGFGHVVCTLAWGIFAFWLLPFFLTLVAAGSGENMTVIAWIELVYYLINAFVLTLVLKEQLSDGFFYVRTDKKEIFSAVFAAFGATVVYILLIAQPLSSFVFAQNLFDVLPLSEMTTTMTPGYMVYNIPVPGLICMTAVVPFSVTALYYATGFAPVCCRNRWLGYLTVAGLLILPTLFDILWRGEPEFAFYEYLIRLPIHWIACWSYQKTDNIWTPVFSLAAVNFATSLLNLAL